MSEVFDKDDLKSLVDAVDAANKNADNASVKATHDDIYDTEFYEAQYATKDTATELCEYVEEHLSAVRALRTSYAIKALDLFDKVIKGNKYE